MLAKYSQLLLLVIGVIGTVVGATIAILVDVKQGALLCQIATIFLLSSALIGIIRSK